VIAVLLGLLFVDERFGPAQFVGGLVVLGAVVLVVRGEQRAKEKTASVTEGCPR
jgi:drug/metabolite transporter (DMT)-like permease